MFLYQKYDYEIHKILNDTDFDNFIKQFKKDNPEIVAFDTETTGLNFITDKAFLFIIGWNKQVYTIDYINFKNLPKMYSLLSNTKYIFAHNIKFDYHMLINAGYPIPDNLKLYDSMTVARLTTYADERNNISLETLGINYVDKNAKFAGKAIKELINKMNRNRLKEVKHILKEYLDENDKLSTVFEAYKKRVQFISTKYDKYFELIDNYYKKPNYFDIYKSNPNLMISYAIDDVVIILEYLKKSFPILNKIYKDNNAVFEQESKLIRAVAYMERNGLSIDRDYLLKSRDKVKQYIDTIYNKLWNITNEKFKSGQHKVIMQYFLHKYDINMSNCDMQQLNNIKELYKGEPSEVANYIIELRTLDKWLTTYIEGMLNRVINDRIYTSINNSGAVTGRVTSDLQQQPKEPLITSNGEELFHPRKVFINDENTETYYFDFSQMELRLQANYTVEISGGDFNLCRAFIPFKCNSILTNKIYDLEKDYNNWNKGIWVNENNEEWKPTDLHTVTTLKAFPNIKITDKDFKHYRKLGKMCNFLKNYGGGIEAIKEQLKVNEDIAQALNNGYYKAFPKVLDYQKWVEDRLLKYGYIENIFGRKYYLQSRNKFYKAYNYVIQGGCADIVKNKEIKIYELFKKYNVKSKMLLPIHDELQFAIYKDEKWLIPIIKNIMDDNKEYLKYIPMICDIEVTYTNWAEKEDYK